MRRFIKSTLRRFGIEAWPLSTIPRGILLEQDLRRIWSNSKQLPLTFFDVGANIGQTAIRFKKGFPEAQIYSFEPSKATFVKLEQNTTSLSDVHCFQTALGDRNGGAIMEIEAESVWNRIMDDQTNSSVRTERVTMQTLDTFCQEQEVVKIDLLKTDCEGYDLQVLEGATTLFGERRIDAIYSEVNFERSARYGDFFAIERFLGSRGFTVYGIYDYSYWGYDIAEVGFANALFVHKEVCTRVAGTVGRK
jgi:FkbM family methyltransferase